MKTKNSEDNNKSKSGESRKNNDLNYLKDFTKEQIISTIKNVIDKNDSFKNEVFNLIDKNKDNFKKINEDEKNYSTYCSLWEEAEEIISKFNEYGGGDDEEQDIVYNNFDKIVKLFQLEKLDKEKKIEFINNCFECYFWGNSGFEDLLRDSVFDVCNCKEDWLFVIEKLKRSSSNYDANCIMEIYKDKLNDDETYLKLRMDKLHFGTDYFDLVDYYRKKGDIEKSVEIAKEGIEKGNGRISDLIEFLLEIYIKMKDYENTLKYKILSFKENLSFDKYLEIRKFCNEENSKKVLNELNEIINDSRNEELKAEVNYFNKDYRLVLEYLKNNQEADFLYATRFKEWAQKLEPHFSQDIMKIYLDKVQRILKFKISKEYSAAEYYLNRIKTIYIGIANNKKEWENLLFSLNQKSIKLPSFQKILRNLEEKR